MFSLGYDEISLHCLLLCNIILFIIFHVENSGSATKKKAFVKNKNFSNDCVHVRLITWQREVIQFYEKYAAGIQQEQWKLIEKTKRKIYLNVIQRQRKNFQLWQWVFFVSEFFVVSFFCVAFQFNKNAEKLSILRTANCSSDVSFDLYGKRYHW